MEIIKNSAERLTKEELEAIKTKYSELQQKLDEEKSFLSKGVYPKYVYNGIVMRAGKYEEIMELLESLFGKEIFK